MKKICILLSLITLVSCCFVGCQQDSQNSTGDQANTVQTRSAEEESQERYYWESFWENRRLKEIAKQRFRQNTEYVLRNPDSYRENSLYCDVYRRIVTTSSGDEERRFYVKVSYDYSAQNGYGGYDRNSGYCYYYFSADDFDKINSNWDDSKISYYIFWVHYEKITESEFYKEVRQNEREF